MPAFAAEARRLEKLGLLDEAEAVALAATEQPAACLWQARYRALAGDLLGAEALIAPLGPVASWPLALVTLAVAALDTKRLFAPWLETTARLIDLVASNGRLGREYDRLVFERLARIGSFFALDEEPRALAASIWARGSAKRILPFLINERRIRNCACFIAARPEIGWAPAALAALLAEAPDAAESWSAELFRLHKAGAASNRELATFATRVDMGKRFPFTVARLLRRDAHEALRIVLAARPDETVRAADRWARDELENRAPWLVERDLHRLAGAGLADLVAAARLRPADHLGLPVLALARAVARLEGTPRQRITAAKRLAASGCRLEAAKLLEPAVPQDADAAYHWAKASAGGLEEDGAPPWAAAHARWPTRRIRNSYASALATDELTYADALALLDASRAEEPDDYDTLKRIAAVHRLAGDRLARAAVVNRMVDLFPDDGWVQAQRLRLVLSTGDIDAVERETELLAQTADPDLKRLLAELHLIQGRNADSSEAWREAARLHGGDYLGYRYAVALFQENRFDDAVAELHRLVARDPGYWRLHLKLGQAQERMGDHAAALLSFAQLAALEPGSVEAAAGVGRCLVYLRRADDCDAWLSRFDDRRIDRGWIHSLRAFNRAMNGRGGEVAEALAPLHALAAAFWSEREAQLDPSAVWLRGRFVHHPHPSMPQVNRVFARELHTLREADGVAVIGNSPLLLGRGHGDSIDRHAAVLRINDFETAGFEADVGARTTLWYSAATRTARPRAGTREEVATWIYQDKSYELPDLQDYARLRLRRALSPESACFLPPDIHHLSSRLITPRPTSGTRMIGLVEFLGQRPYDIYGFDLFTTSRMHYFEEDNRNLHLSEFHAVAFERDFIETVLSRGPFLRRGDG